MTGAEIARLLRTRSPERIERIRLRAEEVLLRRIGPGVSLRGLIEFSNECIHDCLYCGIRRSRSGLRRYRLSGGQIVAAARRAADLGYGSVVLQSGERRDEAFIGFVEQAVADIKRSTRSARLPEGLGVTLSVGEQSPGAYRRFFAAGAHRYLLRIETASPRLFRRIHPWGQTLAARLAALRSLRDIGFQVGTGVMIGLPGQTCRDLASDILFFKRLDADMIGMGPYLVHHRTPMAGWPGVRALERERTFRLSLLMIALCRIALPEVNIAASTALEAVHPSGREAGLRFGANVLMPQVTPAAARPDYRLYDGKPCLAERESAIRARIERQARRLGRSLKLDDWGDSPRARLRRAPRRTRPAD